MRSLFTWEEISVKLLEVGAASPLALQLMVNGHDSHVRSVLSRMVKDGFIEKKVTNLRVDQKRYALHYCMLSEKGIEALMKSETATEQYSELNEIRGMTLVQEKKEPWDLKMFPTISAIAIAHYLQIVMINAVFQKTGALAYPIIDSTVSKTDVRLNTYISKVLVSRFEQINEESIREQTPMFADALRAKRLIEDAGNYNGNEIYVSVRRSSIRAYYETIFDLFGVYVATAWKKGWTNASLNDDATAYQIVSNDLCAYSSERNKNQTSTGVGEHRMPAIVLVPNVRDFLQAVGVRDEGKALSNQTISGIRRLGDETSVMYVVPESEDCTEALLGAMPLLQENGSMLAGADVVNMEKKRWEDDLIKEGYFVPRHDEYPDSLMEKPFSLAIPSGTRLVHVSPVMTIQSIRDMDAVLNKYPGLIYEIVCTKWQEPYWKALYPNSVIHTREFSDTIAKKNDKTKRAEQ